MAPLNAWVTASRMWSALPVEFYARAPFLNDGFVGCRLKPDRRKTPRYRLVESEGPGGECEPAHGAISSSDTVTAGPTRAK